LGKGKKNQTILLLFQKKILGMEKKIKRFCYFSKKKFWVWKKKSNDFVTFRKKNFEYGKKIKQFCYISKKKFGY